MFDGEVKDVTLHLVSNIAGEVSGTVFLPDGETPAGAGVHVTLSGGLPDITVRTDGSGRYAFAKILPEGWSTIVAADPITGHVVQERIYLQADQDLTADLRLLGRGTVTVTVLDGAGAPIENAFVELKEPSFPFFETAGAVLSHDEGVIRFDGVPEGTFSVTASDDEGRGGRARGDVPGDGAHVDVTVHMTVTGTVTGIYTTPDGSEPIPNAEVMLRQGNGRFLGSTVTSSQPESLGRFSFDFVPAGDVLVTAMDPVTGRIGEASGVVEVQDEVIELEIRQLGLGAISGTVTSGGATVASANVRLTSKTGLSSTIANLRARATTDGAGGFVFDGVPVGHFDLRASVPGLLLIGTESGFIDADSQRIADIEVELAPSGTLTGSVRRPDETTPVPGASVTVRPSRGVLQTDTDGGGRYETAFVPVGPFTIEAKEASGPDAGIVSGELVENETLEVDVIFHGTGSIEGTALDFDESPLTHGTVRLTRSAPFAHDESTTIASDGSFRFFGIPVGTYHLALSVPGEVRRGTASGVIEVDGHVDPITVKLADAGYVTGVVVKEDGVAPAPNVAVEVRGQGFLLTALTGTDGSFRIQGVPLGSLDVWANDPVTYGVARVSGALAANGETVDVGTIALDTEPIAVESISPPAGAMDVTPDTPIVIRFTDPTELSRVTHKLDVEASGSRVTGTMSLSADGLELTWTPLIGGLAVFPPSSHITWTLDAALEDIFGRRMGETFAVDFSTGGAVVTGTVWDGSVPAAGADVTLHSRAGTATTAADSNGAYRFDLIPEGHVTVQAVDGQGRGSSVSTALGPSDGLVTVDLSLAFVGGVSGHVHRFDGTSAGGGIEVVVSNLWGSLAATTTDVDGNYALATVPVGDVIVSARDPLTRDWGVASATVNNGQTASADVTMVGTGSLRVFVRDQTDAVVTTAWTKLSYRDGNADKRVTNEDPETDGSYFFPHVLAGPFDVLVSDPASGLGTTGTGAIVPGQELVLDLKLEPAGSVRVRVLAPDGQSSVPGASVVLSGNPVLTAATTDAQGDVLFENLPVSRGPYRVDVELDGRLRARARDVGVSAGQETAVELRVVGLGTVRGRVIPPLGETLSAAARVDLSSFAQDVGGALSDPDATDGTYVISNVPAGGFRVSARDHWRGFQGEAAGTVTADGEDVVIDIQLVDNAIQFASSGRLLRDGNEARYSVLQRGALDASGKALFDATGEALNLEVRVNGGAKTPFVGLATGSQEEAGRELVTASVDIDGVRVQRKVFVPQDGYFARYLEIFENSGSSAAQLTATLSSSLTSASASNGDVQLVATSDGDAAIHAGDVWLVADDAKDQDPYEAATHGQLVAAFVFAGRADTALRQADFQSQGIDGLLTVDYDVVVPPGGRAILMHFVSQESFRDSGIAAAERLRQLPPEALVGLGLDELGAIINFDVPDGGVSELDPLPALDGQIFGQLLAHDGITGVGGRTGAGSLSAKFRSHQVLYNRIRTMNGEEDGRFSLIASLSPSRNVVVPRTSFTVTSSRQIGTAEAVARADSDFTSRSLTSLADGVSATATASAGTMGPERAIDGNAGTDWRAGDGLGAATLELSLSVGVAVDAVRILPAQYASLNRVHVELLDEADQVLDARLEPFESDTAELVTTFAPPVSGVHRVRFHFEGSPIHIGEAEVYGISGADLGNAAPKVVFSGSSGIRVEVTRAGGDGLQSSVFGRVSNGASINATTDEQGVFALLAPLPPEVAPVDFTLTGDQLTVGHAHLKATARVEALTPDATALLRVAYPETGTITAHLTDGSGNAVPGHQVTLLRGSGGNITVRHRRQRQRCVRQPHRGYVYRPNLRPRTYGPWDPNTAVSTGRARHGPQNPEFRDDRPHGALRDARWESAASGTDIAESDRRFRLTKHLDRRVGARHDTERPRQRAVHTGGASPGRLRERHRSDGLHHEPRRDRARHSDPARARDTHGAGAYRRRIRRPERTRGNFRRGRHTSKWLHEYGGRLHAAGCRRATARGRPRPPPGDEPGSHRRHHVRRRRCSRRHGKRRRHAARDGDGRAHRDRGGWLDPDPPREHLDPGQFQQRLSKRKLYELERTAGHRRRARRAVYSPG